MRIPQRAIFYWTACTLTTYVFVQANLADCFVFVFTVSSFCFVEDFLAYLACGVSLALQALALTI